MTENIEILPITETQFSKKEIWNVYFKAMRSNQPTITNSLRRFFNTQIGDYYFGIVFVLAHLLFWVVFGVPFWSVIFLAFFVQYLSIGVCDSIFRMYLNAQISNPKSDVNNLREYYEDHYFVATVDGKLAGGTALDIKRGDDGSVECMELRRVFVDSKYRGRGIASKLLESVDEYCDNSGLDKNSIFLETSSPQYVAIRFYLRRGFRITLAKRVNAKFVVGNLSLVRMERKNCKLTDSITGSCNKH